MLFFVRIYIPGMMYMYIHVIITLTVLFLYHPMHVSLGLKQRIIGVLRSCCTPNPWIKEEKIDIELYQEMIFCQPGL